ncbi:MAG: GAF domain-containing protein [Deltaproteobacteria bacterium]|nr:GAF domain-containing protein [Deltaproteobacteria bacterium]
MQYFDRAAASAIIGAICGSENRRDVLISATELLGRVLGVSRCLVVVDQEHSKSPPVEWTMEEPEERLDAAVVSIASKIGEVVSLQRGPLLLKPTDDREFLNSIREELSALDVTAMLAVRTSLQGHVNGALILTQCGHGRDWREEEVSLVSEVARALGEAIERTGKCNWQEMADAVSEGGIGERVGSQKLESEERYRRLVDNSDALIFHADVNHAITFISRRALDFFGKAPEDFMGQKSLKWLDFVYEEDRARVARCVHDMSDASTSFEEEFRVINGVTNRLRWLLMRLMPVIGKSGEVEGWDGFGIDITKRHEAQEALVVQSRKIRALYTVSSAIRGYLDPANIASRGLAALCDASGADAGVCYIYGPKAKDKLGLVAHHGFSAEFVEDLGKATNLPSLSGYVAKHNQSVVVPDIRRDPRASAVLAEKGGMSSAVLVPLSIEDEALGAIGLFSKEVAKFDGGDVMLVTAAASQIGLAARQADLFAAYRRQAKKLSALYRMSHELSKSLSFEEIFAQAFSIIKDELGLKRLWLGLLNDTGTRIIGQSAHGPGIKKKMAAMNIELGAQNHPLSKVIRNREAVVIEDPSEILREFGVKRVFSRLDIHSVAMVPMSSGGQVLGVLAVQPSQAETVLDEEALTLLTSLANEIGAVVLAKRFEERMAEGEKMRTAGLLAAGIAHNFNNMLQGILGQASLLEVQSESRAKVRRAARLITEAGNRGAVLVKQLMSFAHLEKANPEVCDVNYLVEREVKSLSDEVQNVARIELRLGTDIPRAYFDSSQLRRIISNLILNARDATQARGETEELGKIEVSTDLIVVDEQHPHSGVQKGSYVRIDVRDYGVGMEEEVRKRCFEPFFTTKNVDPASGLSMSGAGLGLAAAYTLATRNGGTIVVDSKPGDGSFFTLYVPVAKRLVETLSERIEKRNNDENIADNVASEVSTEESSASVQNDNSRLAS